MTFGNGRLFGLSGLRGDSTCGNVVAGGEQLVFGGEGFEPGTTVTITSRSATDGATRTLGTVGADADGSFRVSVAVPSDLVHSLDDPDVSSLVTVGGAGTDADGGRRRVSALSFVARPGSECARYIAEAGDIVDETGTAPSAGSTPDVPSPVLLPQSLEAAYGCGDPAPAGGRSNGRTVIHGTDGDDVLTGTAGRDVIMGGGGNDILCGFDGDDQLIGGGGDDMLLGGAGDDDLLGQNGDDTIIGRAGPDRASGGSGTDHCVEYAKAQNCEAGSP